MDPRRPSLFIPVLSPPREDHWMRSPSLYKFMCFLQQASTTGPRRNMLRTDKRIRHSPPSVRLDQLFGRLKLDTESLRQVQQVNNTHAVSDLQTCTVILVVHPSVLRILETGRRRLYSSLRLEDRES
jgi:hypothetical protein